MTERTADRGADPVQGAAPVLDGPPGEVIAAVWAEALGVETVDPDAGFFDLGATSVVVLGVVRVLRGRWPRLQVVHVFSHPTVTELAAFLGDG